MTEITSARSQDITAVNVDDMVRLTNAYHHACSFERGLQVLLDAALDTNGADAVLESRSRQAAINELKRHVSFLEKSIAATPAAATETITSLQQQRTETLAKIHGLEIAVAQQKVTDPQAGDAVSPPGQPQVGAGNEPDLPADTPADPRVDED